jgi:hypothetical protein
MTDQPVAEQPASLRPGDESIDWAETRSRLDRVLRIRTTPIGMKMFETVEDASIHQHAMDVVPAGRYQAMAVSPLSTGRLNPPDICMIYATPGAGPGASY